VTVMITLKQAVIASCLLAAGGCIWELVRDLWQNLSAY